MAPRARNAQPACPPDAHQRQVGIFYLRFCRSNALVGSQAYAFLPPRATDRHEAMHFPPELPPYDRGTGTMTYYEILTCGLALRCSKHAMVHRMHPREALNQAS